MEFDLNDGYTCTDITSLPRTASNNHLLPDSAVHLSLKRCCECMAFFCNTMTVNHFS